MGRQSFESRRAFIARLSATLGAASAASLFPQLALIPNAAHASVQNLSGYRALVCIYLGGGNDSFNWLVPLDFDAPGSRYSTYRNARGGVNGQVAAGLALAFNDLLRLDPVGAAHAYGLHPAHTDFTTTAAGTSQNHPGLQSLFNQGRAAFVCNTGPLVQPISMTEFNAGAPRPEQLYSHNDQERLWHTGIGRRDGLSRFGWGGRLAKALTSGPNVSGLSPTISVAGAAHLLNGDGVLPYQIASTGVDTIDHYHRASTDNADAARRAVLDDLLDDPNAHPFVRGYSEIARRSLSVGENLAAALQPDGSASVQTLFPAGNTLAEQLRLVARMIKFSKSSLNLSRQVYYVRLGGFDLHSGLFVAGRPAATSGHGALLTLLNQAIGAFWTALGEIGAQNEVTTFTMSEFGRTLNGNQGTDHAWGGNQLVLGGAVRGNRLYGTYPQLQLSANDNALRDYSFARGQYIPTTSVDQIAATLARWMGVTDSSALDSIFPLLRNFNANDLGFMSA